MRYALTELIRDGAKLIGEALEAEVSELLSISQEVGSRLFSRSCSPRAPRWLRRLGLAASQRRPLEIDTCLPAPGPTVFGKKSVAHSRFASHGS